MTSESRRSWGTERLYFVVLATAIHVVLGVDRAIMSVLAEPIKREFVLTDTQIALLAGIGFSLFYSAIGLFVGWMVDNLDRVRILSVSVAIFGLATVGGAWAGSFLHLLFLRMFVGAGEAGGGPAMVAMISDRFPEGRRGFPMSVFYAGAPLGLLATFLLGGYVAAHHGWRIAFVVAGLPGVAMAGIALLTLRDRRPAASATELRLPYGAALRHIWARKSARWMLAGAIFHTAPLAALIAFLVSFLVRSHGFALGDASLLLALSFGVAGTIGAPLSGVIVDRLSRRDPRWRSWWLAVVLLASYALAVGVLLVEGRALVVTTIIAWGFLSNAISGPAMAALQSVLAARARGLGASIYYLLAHLVGTAGGTLLVGAVSDALVPWAGAQALRYALLIGISLNLVAALLWLRSARSLPADLATARGPTEVAAG